MLKEQLEKLRSKHGIECIIIINAEGVLISQVGNAPDGEEFALYSPMVMETTRRMAQCGGFGEPICNGIILEQGRILITHETVVNEDVIYMALLCRNRVPAGLKGVLKTIAGYVAATCV